MRAILTQTAHRPWPLPAGPYAMQMTWKHLLFMHWPIPVKAMRALVPAELELDTYDGRCWLGVVPFLMTGVRPHYLPGMPGAQEFPELNVRTYVTLEGKPGVYFFSLDAASWLAVQAARAWAHLPYYLATMKCDASDGRVSYASIRAKRDRTTAEFRANYSPTGPVMEAQPGSLEHWLTERYCLYTTWRGRAYRLEIHHLKWPLQPATAEVGINTMAAPLGLALPDAAPLLHYAEHLAVAAWAPAPVKHPAWIAEKSHWEVGGGIAKEPGLAVDLPGTALLPSEK